MSIEIFDTHTHLDSEEFDSDREEVIKRAQELGVNRILCVGASKGLKSAHQSLLLAKQYPHIYCSVGLHPQDADQKIDYAELELLANNQKVVAIGETGLDFFRDWSSKANQYQAFHAQIELAKKLDKPIIIHSRDAGAECLKILTETNAAQVGGVFHCYSEDQEFAKELAKINFLVSFPGTLTFKKAEQLRNIAKIIPIEQIMLETDAPYMAPEPFRGKRCETGFTRYTAEKLAEIKGLTLEEVASITTENALKLFKIDK